MGGCDRASRMNWNMSLLKESRIMLIDHSLVKIHVASIPI